MIAARAVVIVAVCVSAVQALISESSSGSLSGSPSPSHSSSASQSGTVTASPSPSLRQAWWMPSDLGVAWSGQAWPQRVTFSADGTALAAGGIGATPSDGIGAPGVGDSVVSADGAQSHRSVFTSSPLTVILYNCTVSPALPVAWDWLPCTAVRSLGDSSRVNFGASVAVSADASTLAVTSEGTSAALFVYACVQPGWACTRTPDTGTSALALGGYSTVAVSADGRAVVTGTPDSTGYRCGAAQLLDCSSPPCVLAAALLPQSGCGENSASWRAGFAVAMSASAGKVAVGAPAAWNGSATTGAVLLYVCTSSPSTSCFLAATLFEPTGAEAAAFGHSVVLSSDGSTLCAGAPGFRNSTGRVYCFAVGPRGSVALVSTLDAQAGLGSGSNFGYSLAASADATLLGVGSVATTADPTGLTFYYAGGPADWFIAAEAHGAAYAGLALSARGSISAFADPHGDAIAFGYPFAQAQWASASISPSQSDSPSTTASQSESSSTTASQSESPSMTASVSRTPTTTATGSPSASQRASSSPTASVSRTPSATASQTHSASQRVTPSQSRTSKPTASGSGTRTQRESYHLTATQSRSSSPRSSGSSTGAAAPSTRTAATSSLNTTPSATATHSRSHSQSATKTPLPPAAASAATTLTPPPPSPTSLAPIASVLGVLASRGLSLHADVVFASASSVGRLVPLEIPAGEGSAAGDVALPPQTRASLGGAPPKNGTGTARASLRAAAGSSAADPCSLAAPDPLGSLSAPSLGVPTALGVRLLQHEATALTARVWLTSADCQSEPLSRALPITPQLAFFSAFTSDARVIDALVPTEARRRLLLAPGCPAGPGLQLADCAASYALLQRGVVAKVLRAAWVVSGAPTAAVVALNATPPSTLYASLPAAHIIRLTTTSLSAALPPYTLLPGFYYTATVQLSLQVSWAWDTTVFASRAFSEGTVPLAVISALSAYGYSPATAASEIFNTTMSVPSAGAYAALALVALPPVMRGVTVSPPSGVALLDFFNVSAGPIETPDTAPLDAPPPATTPSFISALVDATPLPPGLQLALAGGTAAGGMLVEAACGSLAFLDGAAPNATLATSLGAWELDTVLLSFALAVAGAVGSAYPSPGAEPPLSAGEGVASAALTGVLARAPFASAVPGAASPSALCSALMSQAAMVLSVSPLNASLSAPSLVLKSDFENVAFSFRVGTLAVAPGGGVSALSTYALTDSVPIHATAGGDSFVSESSVLATLPLPLESDKLYALSSGTVSNLSTPVFVIARSNARVIAIASSLVGLQTPTSNSSISELSLGYSTANASTAPLPTVLAAATLGALLSSDSTAREVEGTAVTVTGNATSAGGSAAFPPSFTALNAQTRSHLLNVTAVALATMVSSLGLSDTASIDDATALAVALAIRGLAFDPFELTVADGERAAVTLAALLQHSVVPAGVSSNVTALPSCVSSAAANAMVCITAAAHTAAALETGVGVTVRLPNFPPVPHVLFGARPSDSSPPIDDAIYAALLRSLSALSRVMSRLPVAGLPPISVRAGSGVATSGSASFCTPALSLSSRVVDVVAASRSISAPLDLYLHDALPPCGSSSTDLTSRVLPAAQFDPETWADVSVANEVAILSIAQWGLPLVAQDPGWEMIAALTLPTNRQRRLGMFGDTGVSRDVPTLRGLRARRLTLNADCSGEVAEAIFRNLTETSRNVSHSAVVGRGIDSRTLSLSLSRLDGTFIKTWGGVTGRPPNSTVRIAIPFTQGSGTIGQLEAENPPRAQVRLQCPDSGASAAPLPVGSPIGAWYPGPELEATEAHIVSVGSTSSYGGRTATLVAYTVSVDCGPAGAVSVECAKDYAVDATPSVLACPAFRWTPVCGFWVPANVSWSTEGCVTTSATAEGVVCECSHLTDFAARFTAVVDSQPLVFAAAACFDSPSAVADAAGLWGVVAALLTAYALLATMGEVADDVASQQFEKFLSSHPDLNLVSGDAENTGGASEATNLLLDALAGALAEGASVVDGVPVAVIAPLVPKVTAADTAGLKEASAVTSAIQPLAPAAAAARCGALCGCARSMIAIAVSVSTAAMTFACCARGVRGKRTRDSSAKAPGEPADPSPPSSTHHCCCCCRLTSTRGRPRPRALACLPSRYSSALYRRYRALLVLGPEDNGVTPASSTAAAHDSMQPGPRSGPNSADTTLIAALDCPVWWRRMVLLRGLVLHVWVLRVLTCHPILSAFTRFDPFRPRANRLAVALVTALASLFYTAFYFGFRGAGSARVGGSPGSLPPASAADLIVVMALATASGLPLRFLLSWCMRHAGRAEFRRRHPALWAELQARRDVESELARVPTAALRRGMQRVHLSRMQLDVRGARAMSTTAVPAMPGSVVRAAAARPPLPDAAATEGPALSDVDLGDFGGPSGPQLDAPPSAPLPPAPTAGTARGEAGGAAGRAASEDPCDPSAPPPFASSRHSKPPGGPMRTVPSLGWVAGVDESRAGAAPPGLLEASAVTARTENDAGEAGVALSSARPPHGAPAAATARARLGGSLVQGDGAGKPPRGLVGAASRFWRESRRRLALPLDLASAVPGSVAPASPLARAALQLVAVEPDELPPASPMVSGRPVPSADKGAHGPVPALALLPPLRRAPVVKRIDAAGHPQPVQPAALGAPSGCEDAVHVDGAVTASPQTSPLTSNPMLRGCDESSAEQPSIIPEPAATVIATPVAAIASAVPEPPRGPPAAAGAPLRRFCALPRCGTCEPCKRCLSFRCGPCRPPKVKRCGSCKPRITARCGSCQPSASRKSCIRAPPVSSRCPSAWTLAAYTLLLGYLGVISAYLFLFGLWRSASEVREFILAWLLAEVLVFGAIFPLLELAKVIFVVTVLPALSQSFVRRLSCFGVPLLSKLQRDVQGSSGGATLSGRFHNAVFIEGTAAASPLPPDAAFIARSLHLIAALFVTRAWGDGSPRDPPTPLEAARGDAATRGAVAAPPPPALLAPDPTPASPAAAVLVRTETEAAADAWPDTVALNVPATAAAEARVRGQRIPAPLPPAVAAARRRVRATLIQELYLHVRAPSRRLDSRELTSIGPA